MTFTDTTNNRVCVYGNKGLADSTVVWDGPHTVGMPKLQGHLEKRSVYTGVPSEPLVLGDADCRDEHPETLM